MDKIYERNQVSQHCKWEILSICPKNKENES